MATPLHIVSGFLGAGKTSAIRAQLEQRAGERLAVIVNDFGEASLDELTLAEGKPFRITNIPGACVCCTAPDGFVAALGAVLDQGPDRILIEPTGLARPQDLIDTIRRSPHRGRVELLPLVVLLDPGQLDSGEHEDLLREQADGADVVVANRIDLASAAQLERFDRWVEALWPAPLAVHLTTHGALPPAALEWPAGEGPRLPALRTSQHDHGHASTDGFSARSLRWAPDRVFSRDRLNAAVKRLVDGESGAPLARLKGIFRTQEGVLRLEVAGGVVDARATSFRRDSRVDLIVHGAGDGPLQRAETWLVEALLGDDELRLSAERIELTLADGSARLLDRDLLLSLDDPVDDVSTIIPDRKGAAARISSLWRALELPAAGHVVIVAADGFASEPVPVDTLCQGVLLHTLEGRPLAADKGGPFRLLIPAQANPPSGACANVKAVARLVHRG